MQAATSMESTNASNARSAVSRPLAGARVTWNDGRGERDQHQQSQNRYGSSPRPGRDVHEMRYPRELIAEQRRGPYEAARVYVLPFERKRDERDPEHRAHRERELEPSHRAAEQLRPIQESKHDEQNENRRDG